MKKGVKTRVFALVSSIALLGGTAFVAAGSTGAYFSDTQAGHFGGTVGSIKVAADTPMSIDFSNLLPGTAQTLSVSYTNTGTSPEDVYLAFPNATALSALNNLGHYGSVTVTSSGTASVGSVFYSTNLDDNSAADACGTLVITGCWPLTTNLKLSSSLPAGASDTFHFTFEYASALTGNGPADWNTYPLPGYDNTGTYAACELAGYTHSECSNNQVTINASDGSGAGLPFSLIATQVGITPGATGSKFTDQ